MMIWKKVVKLMITYLVMVAVLSGLVSLHNSEEAMALYNPSTGHQFSLPYDDGNSIPDQYDSIRTVLAGAAYKLGVPADELTAAYDEAQSSIVPLSIKTKISKDGLSRPPDMSSADMSGYLATIFEIMASKLGIPAADISEAWSSTLEEFRKFNSGDGQENSAGL